MRPYKEAEIQLIEEELDHLIEQVKSADLTNIDLRKLEKLTYLLSSYGESTETTVAVPKQEIRSIIEKSELLKEYLLKEVKSNKKQDLPEQLTDELFDQTSRLLEIIARIGQILAL